jgi:integrase
LRGLPIHAVTRRHVAARLNEIIRDHGDTSAARALASLSALFSWAMREGLCDANPTIGTNNPIEGKRPRDRVLRSDEIRAIWDACLNDDFGRIVKLLLLTGCRREEIGGLSWAEIDFERALLNIPGTRIKNHRPLVLPLSDLALSILQSSPHRAGRDLVFGGAKCGFCSWSYETMRLNNRIAEREGKPLAPWRIHDLRRALATHMGEIGILPHIIEQILNHASGHKAGVAGVYNRASYEREVRVALALWADRVASLVAGSEPTILPIAGMSV